MNRRESRPPPSLARAKARLEGALGVPFVDGNAITILKNGVEIFPAMLSAVRESRSTVDFLTFVYWKGEIAQTFARALVDAATRGVRVRVLLDSIGAMRIDREAFELMIDAGVDLVWFRPPSRWAL
ncbi:MAG: cardiolipin synthase B, partial [Acidobacteriota bacterium]|nr:cardiolipin synthase B [Acidobacteriota bacterium]